jgi:hypothetical protein
VELGAGPCERLEPATNGSCWCVDRAGARSCGKGGRVRGMGLAHSRGMISRPYPHHFYRRGQDRTTYQATITSRLLI